MCVNEYFKKNKYLLMKWMMYEFFCSVAIVLWSFFMKSLYDVLVNEGLGSIKNLFIYGLFFVIFYFISSYYSERSKAKYLNGCNNMLKNDLYSCIMNKNINSFNEDNSAKYISILNNDVKLIEEKYFCLLPTIFASYMLAFIAGVTMIFYDALLGTATLFINLLPIVVSYFIGNNLSQKRKIYMDHLEKFNLNIKDIFNGFDIIKTFNAEERVGEKFREINCKTEGKLLELRKSESLVQAVMSTLNYLTAVIQLVLSVYLIYKNYINMGILLGIMQISNYVSNPIEHLSQYMVQYKSVKSIKNRINDILNIDNDISINKVNINGINTISLKDISYSYNEKNDVIKNFSFDFESGKKYAIVGRSGCGKSTLIKLIMHYYENYSGHILIDDNELRNIDKKSLYNNVCLIGQNIMLFDDNIRNNITMFQEFEDKEVIDVTNLVGLNSIVNNSEEGIYSKVLESGMNFSGGEKQRIAIARALIRNTPIIILDEATSNLDNENTCNIENLILEIDKLTSIVVTHKLNATLLKKYDEIIVMSDGIIAEHDSFDNLINKKGLFYNLYKYGL